MEEKVKSFKLRFAEAKKTISARIKAPTGKVDAPTRSGKNITYKFYEMKDFLPLALNVLSEYGIVTLFRIEKKYVNNIPDEEAVLEIMDCYSNESLTFTMPTVDATTTGSAIQNLGAKTTFLRRYCYINALDISMNDAVEPRSTKRNDSYIPQSIIDTLKIRYSNEELKQICIDNNVQKIYDLPIDVATSLATMNKR